MTDQKTMAIESSPPRKRVRGHHLLLLAVAAALVIAIRVKWFSGASEAAPVTAAIPHLELGAPRGEEPAADSAAETSQSAEAAPSADVQLGQKLLGSWRDKFYGERTMTFHDDGTGLMVIKLDTAGQLLYGEKLEFDLAWTIQDGVLDMSFTDGRPKSAMSTIVQFFGARHEQRIEQLDGTDLHLRSTDSGNLYKLKRVEDPAAKSAALPAAQ